MNSEKYRPTFAVGESVTLTPERVAHGGALVARYEGRVFFVRHALLGETVRARITGTGPKQRFYFADVIEVLESSPKRRQHPWAPADALATYAENRAPLGGMEFGHIEPATQRDYKKAVVAEQLVRLGGMNADNALLESLTVHELSAQDLSQRTRVHFGVDSSGHIAMYPYQSDSARAVENFPLAASEIAELHLEKLDLSDFSRVDAAVSSTGQRFVQFTVRSPQTPGQVENQLADQLEKLWGDLDQEVCAKITAERIAGRRRGERAPDVNWGSPRLIERFTLEGTTFTFAVDGSGFWQNHRLAPQILAATVRDFANFKAGESVLDLYSGAGLFTAVAADAVGADGYVLAVEGSPVTSANAEDNFVAGGVSRTVASKKTQIVPVRGDVAKVLGEISKKSQNTKSSGRSQNVKPQYRRAASPDVVVLDPSREGAGKQVCELISNLNPRAVVYVACDPAALGRDTGYMRELGWRIDRLESFDLYPNTHHVETVARFVRF